MPKLCEFENCMNRACYARFYGKPERCKEHSEGRKLQYSVCKCGKTRPNFNSKGETKGICCSKCKEHGMVDIKHKRCKCGKAQPIFNLPGEAKAICCLQCREKDMVNVKNKMCKCGKAQPHSNYPGETKAICCLQCREVGMVNVKNKMCKCGKAQPHSNYPGETKAICCIKCREEGMVNVISKRCKCGITTPHFNYPEEIKAICCIKCKELGMINIICQRCIKCKNTPAFFNFPEETKAICCSDCKEDGMIYIKLCEFDKCMKRACYGRFYGKPERCKEHCDGRKGQYSICKCGKTRPNFNYLGETKAICCVKCKEDCMVDINNKKCKCGKTQPHFNYPEETKAICCSQCRDENMIDLSHKYCPNCIDWLDSTFGNKKYKGYCTHCYQQLFPTDPLTFQIRSKTKEIAVRDYINAHYKGFIHDKALWTGGCDCTVRRRIDHRILLGNTLLCIETDEHQHMSYDPQDEINRYDDLYMAHSGKWIFIRFNPDKYTDHLGKRRNPEIATRLRALKKQIDTQMQRIQTEKNKELVEIIPMYYNEI